MKRISLAGWSLRRRFQRKDAERLRLTDYPRVARTEFGIDAIELNSPFFDSLEEPYLRELRAAADSESVQLLNIAVDRNGNLSSADAAERADAVERHSRWLEIGAALGCETVRANTGAALPEDRDALRRCADSFAHLAEMGASLGVAILIENHGGLSADPDNVVWIVKQVGENIGTLPDFGNVEPSARVTMVEKLAPYARAVHVKTSDFDEYGEEVHLDVPRLVQIVKAAGYEGYFGIEYVGGEDDRAGVLKSKTLLERYV